MREPWVLPAWSTKSRLRRRPTWSNRLNERAKPPGASEIRRGGPSRSSGASDAILEERTGELEEAEAMLQSTLTLDSSSQLPLQHARTALVLGRVRRRARKLRAARAALEEALEVFERVGAELWAARAREELTRIGGRSASAGNLTPAEQRVAALVAEGKSNKQVAAALVVSVHTVEGALTSIYRKLDVHSRTEMARRLVAESKD